MKKEEIKHILETVRQIEGKRLNKITRAASMGCFGFGDLVKVTKKSSTLRNNLESHEEFLPRWSLHADCCFRFACGDTILLTRSNMFLPSEKLMQTQDFDWGNYAWDVPGNNYFDEIVLHHFQLESTAFVVQKVTVNQFGDLTISFDNHFMLEIIVDLSGPNECWRFFDMSADAEHLVILGDGIDDENE